MSNDNENSYENSPELNSANISESKEGGTWTSSSGTSAAHIQTNSAVLVSSLIINQALENFSKGKQKEYDALVQKLGDQSLTSVHLRRYLKALRRCTSSLTKKCDILVATILRVNWANADDGTADEFVEFLMSLVSAQTYYLRSCLRMLTKLFLPTIPKGVEPEDINAEKQQSIFDHAHEGLQAILEIVPTTPKFLLPILSDHFPYIKKHSIYQTSYVKNLLRITQYLPALRQDILECVINHVTKIDVEVPRHELQVDEQEEEENTQFEVDLECMKKEDITDGSNVNVENEMAETLDQLMEIVFNYIREMCFVDGVYLIDGSSELFNQLITVFDKIIFPTHASCHVHFAVFYICSLDQIFVNSFLDFCWKKIEDINTPAIIRQTCAAYIASIVARAKYITVSTVKVCLELLTHWVHCYIDVHDASCTGPDTAKHGPFYSVCQALLYMFVFRHRCLLEDLEDGHKFVRRLNFERIITSRLNPLKVCLPTIVNLFAHITRQYEILLCYTVIERNKRSMLPVATQSNKVVSRLTVFNQLDSFFPFDPYLLRRSSKFIKPLYQEWQGIEEEADIHDQLNEQTNDFESEDEEGDEYMSYGKTPDIDVPGLTPETSAMCISPGFAFSPMEHEAKLHTRGPHRVTKHNL